MSEGLVVRACDVGYGHVKFTDGRDAFSGDIRCESFPSQAPAALDYGLGATGGVVERPDTFVVSVNQRRYEVGRAVSFNMAGNAETEMLDPEFALSDGYLARLYGALSYMLPGLTDARIDFLVLGLPLNTYSRYGQTLSHRCKGEHCVAGDAPISIGECFVYPQPLGSYAAYLSEQMSTGKLEGMPTALVVDPGYNTIDWFVCRGMTPNQSACGAAMLGMSGVLKRVAHSVIDATQSNAPIASVVRSIDQAWIQDKPFRMFGKPVDLAAHLAAGEPIIEDAAQAVKNAVGVGNEIDVILLGGGGAHLYRDALQRRFPQHDIVLLDQPAFGNVRGFQLLGERIASSAARARTAA